MKTRARDIEVWADWSDMGGGARMGVLHAAPVRGKEVFSFEYDSSWLQGRNGLALDPALQLYRGKQFAPAGRENFGVFLDSCPDRWGRTLMRRREAQLARRESRAPRQLLESDYLLGVFDRHRMGALRFRVDTDGPFLDDQEGLASPPWTSLRELERASLALESEDAELSSEYDEWLRMLMAPGASLGGARPKADVIDPSGRMWIAKFPSLADADDVGAWEHLAHELATASGISTSASRAQVFGSKRHTFLTLRFDRTARGERIHFASAMTLLGRSDGGREADQPGYLEIAELITRQGTSPHRDLEELWRRIVFSVCISNVDDHLRNHGFVLRAAGWELSPAFDMNPVATGNGLSLDISDTDNAQDLDLVRDVSAVFRVKSARANQIIDEVVSAVRTWRTRARAAGIPRAEQDRMAPAFRVAER